MANKTPHINLKDENLGFGKTVLMPGDPLRAKYIAENFLEDAVLVNGVRGVNGYTGYYKGVKVSVMASGMGMPSIGIYSYELYHFFGVQNIIRVGSAGAINEKVKVRDIVIGMGACTNSNFASQYNMNGTIAPICDFDMLSTAKNIADGKGLNVHIGNLYSSDTFYDDSFPSAVWGKVGCLAVEMEAAALYCTAMRYGMRALAICTVSDTLYPPFVALEAEEREKTFTQMMELALDCAVEYEALPLLEPKK
ncbi:MAG: purine-nucleoside phosphorylase [Clostridia bacterium]|nr:purine-nucleoside phosphorylase [Clostridia bacterium]